MKEWLYFAYRGGKSLFKGMPSSIHGWKERFFFVTSKHLWGFNPKWDTPWLKENNLLPNFTDAEKGIMDALRSLEGDIHLPGLVSEEALVNVGLSPATPEEIAGMVFDDNTLLARYNKRAAETGGSRVQPRSKKARTSSGPTGGNSASPGSNAPGPVQRNKEPVSASRLIEASGSQARHEGPARSNEIGEPTSTRMTSPRPASGSIPSSRVPPTPSSSRPRPPSSLKSHPPSSSGVNLPSSEEARIGSHGDPYDPEWSLSETDSALEDSRIAREVVRGASLPIDRAIMKITPFREFIDQTYCSAIRHLHEVDMMAEAVSSFVADSQASEGKLLAFKKELGVAQTKLREAEEKAKRAETELGRANERIRQVEAELGLSQSNLRTSEARSAGFSSELEARRHENDLLKSKLRQAEEKEKSAVEQAKTAVLEFRRSAKYQDELEEEAVDGLVRGFEDFRRQAARLCPQVDFSRLRPRLGSEGEQDLSWVEELEDAPFEVVPPRLPEVTSEVVSEMAFEGVGNPALEVDVAADVPEVPATDVPEVAAADVPEVAAADSPEVAPGAAIVTDPSSSITNVGDRV